MLHLMAAPGQGSTELHLTGVTRVIVYDNP
jgi:hypothetical protein